MKRFLLAPMLCALAFTSSAAPILDNFDDPAINTNLWNVLLPAGAAQVSVASGRALLQARGGLSPIPDYLCDAEVQGRFRFTGTSDRFEVVLRSSLSFASPAGDRTGLSIFFDQTNNVIGLNEVGIGLLVSRRFIFHPNEDVTFKITDDGENVSIYVNNLPTPFITDFSLLRTGSKIAFYNRDIAGAQTESISSKSQAKKGVHQSYPSRKTSIPWNTATRSFPFRPQACLLYLTNGISIKRLFPEQPRSPCCSRM